MDNQDKQVISYYQDQYFEIITEFFTGVTGSTHVDFCEPELLADAIRKMGDTIKSSERRVSQLIHSYITLEEKLKRLYSQEGFDCFKSAKNISCCKLNLGGGSRFLETQLNAVRKSILFSDIILIPDPIMPWLESKREHEKFREIHVLQAAYFILHLQDFASTDYDFPPFLIFPSWEKTLEEKDGKTVESTQLLIADIFSHYIEPSITTIDEAFEFIDSFEDEFLQRVEKANLFVSPGGRIGDPLKIALANYKQEMTTWRSKQFNEAVTSASDGRIVMNAIMERIQPQYHAIENSQEFKSNPLYCLDAHAHYFQLISGMANKRVENLVESCPSTLGILKALMSKRLDFLANIRDKQLVLLRKSNENIVFRRKLREFVNTLPETKLHDISYIASEVCSHICALISEHEKQIESLNSKYTAKHKYTALIAGGGLAVSMMPSLAPLLGATLPIALTAGGKWIAEKFEERSERKMLTSSMLGVFALAKKSR